MIMTYEEETIGDKNGCIKSVRNILDGAIENSFVVEEYKSCDKNSEGTAITFMDAEGRFDENMTVASDISRNDSALAVARDVVTELFDSVFEEFGSKDKRKLKEDKLCSGLVSKDEEKTEAVVRRNKHVRKRRKEEKEKRVSFNLDEDVKQKRRLSYSNSLPNLKWVLSGNQSSDEYKDCDCLDFKSNLEYKEKLCECCNYAVNYPSGNTRKAKEEKDMSSLETVEDIRDLKENINEFVSNLSKETLNEEENNNLTFQESNVKDVYRNSFVLDNNIMNLPVECRDSGRNRDSLYSLDEYEEDKLDRVSNPKLLVDPRGKEDDDYSVIDEEEEKDSGNVPAEVVRKKKKKSLMSFFGKKSGDREKQDDQKTQPNKILQRSRKYSSAMDVSEKNFLNRTPSFIKRLTRFSHDASSKLKRTFSYRDLNRSRESVTSSPVKMLEKNTEWAKSLQNLIESDVNVSYNDLSFVNYDVLNTVSYDEPKKCLLRTQSLHVQVRISLQRDAILL